MQRNLGKDNKNSNNNNTNKIIQIDETLGAILLAITNVNRKRDKNIEKTLQIKRTKYTVQCKESLNSFDLVTFLLILYFFQEKPIIHNDKEIAINFYENELKKLINNESETNYKIINFYKYMIKKNKI